MLRLFRIRKSILSLGAQSYSTRAPQPEVVHIQRVRFRRKRPKTSSILISFGASYAFYEIVTRGPIVFVDDETSETDEQEDQELDDRPIFIPFPGFTRTVDPEPFRGSDPEWRAYVKVSKDKELLESIRLRLAEMARRAIANGNSKHRGKAASISKYWLDIHYPFRPPPTFVRQGLSFGGGDGITWTEKPVDSVAVFWTRQALWPSAATSSLWSFVSTLMTQNANSIVKFLGYGSQTDPLGNMQQTIDRIQQQLKKQSGKDGSISPPSSSQDQTGGGSTSASLPPVEKRSTAGTTTTPETFGTGAGVGNAIPSIPSAKDTYMIRAAQEHTGGSWNKLKTTMAKNWRAPTAYPPRGSIRVSGLVEIVTPASIVTLDCLAWWDPQTQKFDPKTTVIELRTIRPKQQSPLR